MERVTIMPFGDSDGNKLDPFLIFKTKPSKIADTARETRRRAINLAGSFGQSLRPYEDPTCMIPWYCFGTTFPDIGSLTFLYLRVCLTSSSSRSLWVHQSVSANRQTSLGTSLSSHVSSKNMWSFLRPMCELPAPQ
ncbi:hypothetical protein PF010_g18162 [Phytophthora fragariae]|uniref:Uncharacterized protein n=1 Tax=Phytophthora fragariae TaxID=53985 RepID=A0A6G0KLX8_9STRA|nr:hypothetical protein PF010_g18162 [Phytophthora fragariae]